MAHLTPATQPLLLDGRTAMQQVGVPNQYIPLPSHMQTTGVALLLHLLSPVRLKQHLGRTLGFYIGMA